MEAVDAGPSRIGSFGATLHRIAATVYAALACLDSRCCDTSAWDWMPGSALVQGAGGVARQVTVRGYTWSLAGPPTAVAEAARALEGS